MQKTGLKLKDKSKQSKGEYLFDHILYGTLFAYDIYNILPHVIPIARYTNSISRLVVCMLLNSLFGIFCSYNFNRNGKGVLQDLLSGIGAYTILTVGKYASGFIKCLFIGALVTSAFRIILILSKRVKRKDRIKQIMISRFLRSTQVVRRNVGVAATIAVIALPIGLSCFQNDKLNEDYYEKVCEEYGLNAEDIQGGIGMSGYEGQLSVYENYGDEYRLEKNIDTIKLIRDNDIFQTLDYEKKCDVLRAICYCEARYLGLCKINIEFEDIEDDTLIGTYNHATKTITVNAKPIKDGNLPGSKSSQTIAAKKRNTTSAVLTYRAALLPKANRNGNSTAAIKSAATTSKNSMVPSMDMYKTIFSASSSFLIPPRTNLCKTTSRFASV